MDEVELHSQKKVFKLVYPLHINKSRKTLIVYKEKTYDQDDSLSKQKR